ncbi:Galactosyltransferase family protein [Aphelenchoides avenae]|nr:Galactosyltransferase family protein [Aphelenchus avenae]
MHGFQVRTVFAVGRLNSTNHDLRKEHETYGDLAVGDFVDSYHANTKKFLLQIKLASNYCGLGTALPYVFLVDDDHYVIIRNLLEEALKHSPKEPLYMGWAQMSAPPMRYVWNKNYVSVSDYPYEKYPPFVSGGAVLLSQKTIDLYYSAIPRIKPFKWEDVYAGIISRILGIKALHNPNFRFKATGPSDPAMLTGIASHGYQLGEA